MSQPSRVPMHVRPRRRRGSLSVLFGWNLDWKPVRSNNGAVRTRQSLVVGVVYLRRFCANVMSEFEKKMKRFQADAWVQPGSLSTGMLFQVPDPALRKSSEPVSLLSEKVQSRFVRESRGRKYRSK